MKFLGDEWICCCDGAMARVGFWSCVVVGCRWVREASLAASRRDGSISKSSADELGVALIFCRLLRAPAGLIVGPTGPGPGPWCMCLEFWEALLSSDRNRFITSRARTSVARTFGLSCCCNSSCSWRILRKQSDSCIHRCLSSFQCSAPASNLFVKWSLLRISKNAFLT